MLTTNRPGRSIIIPVMVPVVVPAVVIVVVIVVMTMGHDDHFFGFGRGSGKTGEANDGQEQDEQCFHIAGVKKTNF